MLTPVQKTTLKTFINNTPVLSGIPNSPDGNFEIAVNLNQSAIPSFWVWKTNVPTEELMSNGFDWQRVDNLSVGKARIFEWMNMLGSVNPSKTNVRDGINACFAAVGDAATRQSVFNQSQRPATVVEKIFASGAGVTTSDAGVGPATLIFVGPINHQDVEEARNS